MLTVKKCWNTTAYKRNLQTVVFLQPRCHPWEQGWGVPVFANLCSEPGGRGRLGREDHPVCTLDSCCYPGGPPGGGASLDPQLVNPVDSFIELDVQKNFHPALEPKNFFTLVTYYYLRVLFLLSGGFWSSWICKGRHFQGLTSSIQSPLLPLSSLRKRVISF